MKFKKNLLSLFALSFLTFSSAFAAIPLPTTPACPIDTKLGVCKTPVGFWLTIDDTTQKPRAVVEISYSKSHPDQLIGVSKFGFYQEGKTWSNTYRGSYQPFQGKVMGTFPIMWGYLDQGQGYWKKGQVFDVDSSKVYRSYLHLVDSGNHLKLYGCVAFLCRSQTWVRLTPKQLVLYKGLSVLDEKNHPKKS